MPRLSVLTAEHISLQGTVKLTDSPRLRGGFLHLLRLSSAGFVNGRISSYIENICPYTMSRICISQKIKHCKAPWSYRAKCVNIQCIKHLSKFTEFKNDALPLRSLVLVPDLGYPSIVFGVVRFVCFQRDAPSYIINSSKELSEDLSHKLPSYHWATKDIHGWSIEISGWSVHMSVMFLSFFP